MENKRAHLEMIQNIIGRLASNSFFLKGWTITLTAGLFALGQKESNPNFILLAYFPAIIFWILDSYYLWQEGLFRYIYDIIRVLREEDIDYSMSTRNVPKRYFRFFKAIFSSTIILFHGTIIITISIIIYFSIIY